jgi:hypothetical protein
MCLTSSIAAVDTEPALCTAVGLFYSTDKHEIIKMATLIGLDIDALAPHVDMAVVFA